MDEILIPNGVKFSSEDELKELIEADPALHGIKVVLMHAGNGLLEVHSCSHEEQEAQEFLSFAQAVSEQLQNEARPFIYN